MHPKMLVHHLVKPLPLLPRSLKLLLLPAPTPVAHRQARLLPSVLLSLTALSMPPPMLVVHVYRLARYLQHFLSLTVLSKWWVWKAAISMIKVIYLIE
jgi:hypothetical protein